MANIRAAIAAGALAVALGLAGCGSTTPKAVPPSPSTVTAATTSTLPPASTVVVTTTVAPEFPKTVPLTSIGDSRIRSWAKLANPKTGAVAEVAPGVYATLGQGPLGTVADYKGVFGLCADVTPFETAHQTGGTCW